jgi:IS30 family transposase
MRKPNENTHLTNEERQIIQTGICNGSMKKSIAETIGKDATTVAKEIRKHREKRARNSFNYVTDCAKIKKCAKQCVGKCEQYEPFTCKRRDRTPGACNGCELLSQNKCHWDKYIYDAKRAQREYEEELREARAGINMTTLERRTIGATIAPLLNNGQSVHQVITNHPEIHHSERSMYDYIETDVFKDFGVNMFSLKETVNRKPRKKFDEKYKKRREPKNYEGHKYSDYQTFLLANPDTPVTQMDTVYNQESGPYIQTLHLPACNMMIGFLKAKKTSDSMADTMNNLWKALPQEMFRQLFSCLLTDRGTEFEKTELFEVDMETGELRLNIFYCDPQRSSQKPNVECNHNYVRDVIPNGYCLDRLTQDDIDLMFSHINSTPRASLNNKTPYEMFVFLYGEEAAGLLHIQRVLKDDVILKPKLLKNLHRKD